MTDEVPLVASRQLLQIFATDLSKLEPEAHKEVAQYALLQIQHRVVSFEEQVLFQPCLLVESLRKLQGNQGFQTFVHPILLLD
jgi:hypothetical protein